MLLVTYVCIFTCALEGGHTNAHIRMYTQTFTSICICVSKSGMELILKTVVHMLHLWIYWRVKYLANQIG